MKQIPPNSPSDVVSRCGYVAIIGRPNVGKSTLLNRLLGQKLSITSRKPQTTRHRILGVKTLDNDQVIYVDTPGLHLNQPHALNRHMNKVAKFAIKDVDIIVFLTDKLIWTEEDKWVVSLIEHASKPVILAINKIDDLEDKSKLLPYMASLYENFKFMDIVPISAKTGENIPELEKMIAEHLPANPHFFPADQITDLSLPLRMAELIREQVVRYLGAELPYSTTVEIEKFEKVEEMQHIDAIIWVEKEGQKPIVIGKKGERLKKIGTEARLMMEKILHCRVHLKLWVKVKSGWTDDEKGLENLGY